MSFVERAEFKCKCGCGKGEDLVSPLLLELLNRARGLAEVPFVVTSGYRCEEWNKKVGGVGESSHTKGLAVDIGVTGSSARFAILQALLTVGIS